MRYSIFATWWLASALFVSKCLPSQPLATSVPAQLRETGARIARYIHTLHGWCIAQCRLSYRSLCTVRFEVQ